MGSLCVFWLPFWLKTNKLRMESSPNTLDLVTTATLFLERDTTTPATTPATTRATTMVDTTVDTMVDTMVDTTVDTMVDTTPTSLLCIPADTLPSSGTTRKTE